VPVIVRVACAKGVLDEVFTVSVVLPASRNCSPQKEALAPDGRPVTLRVTAPEKLEIEDVLTV